MNIKLIVVLVALVFLNASGEQFSVPVTLVTSELRVVTNHVFNPLRSIYWKPFRGECQTFLTNGIVLQEFKTTCIYETDRVNAAQRGGAYGTPPARRLVSETKTPVKKFLLRNCPAALQPTTGKEITGKAMQTGTIQIGQDVLEVWDCGTAVVRQAP